MQDFSRFVPNVHFEQIPIKNLVSNQEYQRPLSQAQVEKAIEDFDLNQINPVKVSRRDGVNYVFNGSAHHRDRCYCIRFAGDSCLVHDL